MFRKVIFQITQALMKWCERNGRVFKITGTAGPDDVYLIRYYVIKSKYFNFFVHQFLRSDRDDLHDHPWDFCTYLVSGAYKERKYNPKTGQIEETTRINNINLRSELLQHTNKNLLVFRKATDQHQVLVFNDLKEKDKDRAATTLFFSGPTRREWGFIKEYPKSEVDIQLDTLMYGRAETSERRWILWTDYLGLPRNTKSRG